MAAFSRSLRSLAVDGARRPWALGIAALWALRGVVQAIEEILAAVPKSAPASPPQPTATETA